jgi:hypothetical protein
MNSDDFEPIGVAAQGVLLRLALGMLANEKDCRPRSSTGRERELRSAHAAGGNAAGVEDEVVACVRETGSPCLEGAAGRGCAGE